MTVHCPECEAPIVLPDDLIANGVPKARCRQCGARFRVLPGGDTIVLDEMGSGGTMQPGSSGHPPASGVAFGSESDTPVASTSGAAGLDLPRVTQKPVGREEQDAILAAAQGDRLFDCPKLPVGTVFRQKYRIEAEIGHGASAVVYRARDVDAEIDVALKVVGVVGGQADGIRRAWAEEYKARRQVPDGTHLLSLESPQVQEIDGTTYVALPQELGQSTLRDWLKKNKHTIAEHREEALSLFGQIVRGVEALHKQNLAHLDLKPENIILVKKGKEELVAKVGDFGLARAAGSLSRREGSGTPAYMAPEQVEAGHEKEIGPWSDIYTLGCILFELLDGDPPFSGNDEELKRKHRERQPRDPDNAPPYLRRLVKACLSKARGERSKSIREIQPLLELNPAEQAAFERAMNESKESAWQTFLDQWSAGRYADEARQALRKLEVDRELQEKQERAREKAKQEQDGEPRPNGVKKHPFWKKEVFRPVDVHGWTAARIQDRQQQQARALGIPVVFRDQLKDGSPGPEMVLIPSGIYLMGSPENEPQRSNGESPIHPVTIVRPFAIGKTPITFSEWDNYARQTGINPPDDMGWGRENRPVINISWQEVQRYLAWLSEQTKNEYRLPSEAEWEYAARGGVTGPFPAGNTLTTDQANFDGRYPPEGSPQGRYLARTTPSGSYPSNPLGLYDVLGNVFEFVSDTWNGDHQGAPEDGHSRSGQSSDVVVIKGGSYKSGGAYTRFAFRHSFKVTEREAREGFRVLRELIPPEVNQKLEEMPDE